MQKKYSINFTVTRKKNCLRLHYNGANSYLFVNGTEIIRFKAKDFEIVATPLCLGNISEDVSIGNMKKTGLHRYVYDFSVDYDAIAVDYILEIHKYLIKKNGIIELISKGTCDTGFVWNPSNCDCECDKSCDFGEYLDYKNCKCRKKLIDKLLEECSENIDGNEMIYNGTLNDYENVCNSCTIHTVLFVIAFLIIIGISSAFMYKRSDTNITNIIANTETVIYWIYKLEVSNKLI